MKLTLFGKVFGLCALVLVFTSFTIVLIKLGTYRADAPHDDAFSALLTVEMNESRYAWETGGRDALRATLARLRAETKASEAVFADRDGIDLATGRDRSDLLRKARERSLFSYSGGDRHSFARVAQDGRYWYFLQESASLFAPDEYGRFLAAILLAAIPCWLLVRRLVKPLGKLQHAMNRFGTGQLEARADTGGGDEFGRLGAAFNQMAERIQMLLAAERRLLQDVSHELRSPLTRLQVALELERGSASGAPAVDRIQREVDRLQELVGQLLDVTRAEGDARRMRNECVELNELAAQVVDVLSPEAERKGCRLELRAPDPVTVTGSRELLRRVIENTVVNAIRYAPDRTVVEICLETEANHARIAIRDYGPGVPDDALPRLFDAFYRVEPDRDRTTGGVGLGLAITHRAVSLHRGKVAARNAYPGLLVEIELPV